MINLSGSNYPCLEQFSMVPKMFEPLKFDCNIYLLCLQTAKGPISVRIRLIWVFADRLCPNTHIRSIRHNSLCQRTPTRFHVRPAKTKISLHGSIHADQSLRCPLEDTPWILVYLDYRVFRRSESSLGAHTIL